VVNFQSVGLESICHSHGASLCRCRPCIDLFLTQHHGECCRLSGAIIASRGTANAVGVTLQMTNERPVRCRQAALAPNDPPATRHDEALAMVQRDVAQSLALAKARNQRTSRAAVIGGLFARDGDDLSLCSSDVICCGVAPPTQVDPDWRPRMSANSHEPQAQLDLTRFPAPARPTDDLGFRFQPPSSGSHPRVAVALGLCGYRRPRLCVCAEYLPKRAAHVTYGCDPAQRLERTSAVREW